MAVTFDGSLYVWGGNGYAQLGDGTTDGSKAPMKLMDDVCMIAAGALHSGAVKTDGSLWMWGHNETGQIGNGETKICSEPTKVLDDVAYLALGARNSSAVSSDGSLYVWGGNEGGQIGDGTSKNALTPVLVMKGVMLPDVTGFVPETPEQPEDPSDDASKHIENVRTMISSVGRFGSANLVGPTVNIFGNEVSLFRSDMAANLDLGGAIASVGTTRGIVYNSDDSTVEVLFGLEGSISLDDPSESDENDEEDKAWRETYDAVKSFIESCKGASSAKDVLNRFASLKGNLKKSKSKLVFDADAAYIGYAKFQIDPQGRCVNLIEGGVTTHGEVAAHQRVPLWTIVYSEFGISGEVDGKVRLGLDGNRLILGGEAGIAVKPSVALGADAVIVDVKGGIEGEIGGNLQLSAESIEKALKLYLTGRFFWSADSLIPGLSQEGSYDFPALELYPHLGEVTPQVAALAFEAPEACSAEELAELEDEPSLLNDTVAAPVASTVYENAKPSVVQLSDGRYLCTYLDTVADGTVQLMYRVLSNGKWSDAKPVAPQSSAAMAEAGSPLSQSAGSNARVDTAGVLATASDGSTWVVYERSAKTLDSGMTPEEIASLMELRAARFDASSATFGESIVVAPAGTWKYGYSIGEFSDGKPAVVWAENSANDVLLKSGGTRLYRAELSEGAASPAAELFSCDKVVTEALAFGDHYAFAEGEKLYVDGAAVNTATLGSAVDGLHESGGTLFFRCDGKLCSYAPGEGAQLLGARCAASFVVWGNHVYWIEQDGFYSEIYRSDLAGGSIAAVTEDDAYVGNFDVIANASGDGLLYTCQSVNPSAASSGGNPFGVTVLKYDDSLTRTRVEIADAAYDVMEFDPSVPNRVVATVENTGTELATGVTVEARDGNGNVVATGTLGKTIAPGENAEVELSVTFPEGSTSFDLSFAIASNGSAFAPSGATLAMEVEHDIALARKKWQLPGNYHLVVTNKEPEAVKGVKLHLYDGGESGRLIRTIDMGTLGANASKPVTLRESDWSAATVNTAASAKTIYCVIEHDGIEYSLSDNSAVLTRAVAAQGKPDDGSQGGATKPTTPSNPVTPSQPANPTKPTSPSKPSAAQKTSLAKAAITVKSKAYTGKTQKPAVPVVKVGGKTLRNGIDFTYSCKGGKKIGSYKVTIVGKGSYTGTKTASFQIVPKGTSVSKLTKAKKALTVKWKKPSKSALKQVTGYEIRYSTSKKFTAKTTKVKRVKASSASGKKCSLKVSKLKGGKKYYVQVRTYKKVGKATYYSSWSKVKAVKTKK